MEFNKEEKKLLLKGLYLHWSVCNKTMIEHQDKINVNPNGANVEHISNFVDQWKRKLDDADALISRLEENLDK